MEAVTKLQRTTARRWKHNWSPQCDRKGIGMSRESSTVPVCASQVNTLPRARVDDHLNSFVANKDLCRLISQNFNFSRTENSISCTHKACPVIRIICCLCKCLGGSLRAKCDVGIPSDVSVLVSSLADLSMRSFHCPRTRSP